MSDTARHLLLGADVGGTSTRVAVADRSGRVLAAATGPAGNPNAVGLDTSAARIRTATTDALQQAGASWEEVGAAVLGMAGFGTAIAAGEEFLRAARTGAAVPTRIVSDLGVGYASATPLPRGYVVIAGTGSSAAEIADGEIVQRRGGWGWLLGDEGAGFWLGREAVRVALAEAERGGPYGALTRAVIDHWGLDPKAPLDGLLRAPYRDSPVRLAELAPLVTGLVDTDPAAVAICARAADQLAGLLLALQPMPGRPVVTAGSVLQSAGPIRSAFIDRVAAQLASPVLDAGSGLVGALWLAAGSGAEADPSVHARLVATLDALKV